MATKYKAKQKTHTVFTSAALGVLVSVILSLLCAGALAALVLNGRIPDSSVKFAVPITQVFATLLGAIIAGKLVSEKKVFASVAASAVYFIVLLCITMLFWGGEFKSLWTGFAVILISGAAAAAICARGNGKSSSSVRKRKLRSR